MLAINCTIIAFFLIKATINTKLKYDTDRFPIFVYTKLY